MKKLFALALLFTLSTGLTAQELTASSDAMPVAKWNETTHQFGKVQQDVPVICEFKVTNTGTAPLQLLGVERASGCSSPEWTAKAIQPGATGIVKIMYDAKISGFFSKTIKVLTNTLEGYADLVVTGEVASSVKM